MPARSDTCPSSTTTSSSATRRVPAGAGSSPLITTMSPSGYIGQLRAVISTTPRRGGERWTPGPASAAMRRSIAAGSGWRSPNRPWASGLSPPWKSPSTTRKSPRAIASVLGRGDLQVGGVVGRAVPRRRPVGEGVAGGPAALQLALLVAHLVPEPEARAHQLAEQRRERARAPVRDARRAARRRGRTRARTTSATRRAPAGSERAARRARAGPSVTSRSRMQSR